MSGLVINTTGGSLGSGTKASFLGDIKHMKFGEAGKTGLPYGAIGSAVGGLAGKLVGNGYESTAGQITGQLGQMASMIPGPLGMFGSAALQTMGGVVNRAVGMKVDQEALNAAKQGTDTLNNFKSDASTLDEVVGAPTVAAFKNPYKGGWLSKGKAKAKNKELLAERNNAISFANRSVANNVDNILNEQMNILEANYAAFGGPLDFGYIPMTGAIDYELAQRSMALKELDSRNKGKGLFAEGGNLHSYGTDWTNGITIINNGGTHEENPYEGVPMGQSEDGQPNLVEEGEVIWNDYVFSNRIKIPDAIRKSLKLRGDKDMTFADAAKKAQKETEERPNDPIARRGMEDTLMKIMEAQEIERQKKQLMEAQDNIGSMAADGGLLFEEGGSIHIAPNKRGTFTKAATEHNMGVQEFASEVLAHPNKYSPTMRKKANFAKNASKWHSFGGWLYSCGGAIKHKFPEGGKLTDAEVAYINSMDNDMFDAMLGDIRGTKGVSKTGLEILNGDYYNTPGDPNTGINYANKKAAFIKYAQSGRPGIFSNAAKQAYKKAGSPVATPAPVTASPTTIGTTLVPNGYGVSRSYLDNLFPYNLSKPILPRTTAETNTALNYDWQAGFKNWQKDNMSFTTTSPALLESDAYRKSVTNMDNSVKKANTTMKNFYDSYTPVPQKEHYNPARELRWVPAVGAGIGVFSDLMGWTNKPDYSNANAVLDVASNIRDVQFSPIGDRVRYTPMDRMFHTNILNSQFGSTLRNVLNTSSGNMGTALAGSLAAGYNAQNAVGNTIRGDEEQNFKNYITASEFNRGTNMFNAEQDLKAQIANNSNQRVRMEAAERAAALRDAIDARVSAARSANLTNFFDSLGDIGREAYAMDMIHNNKALLYDWMGRYKGALLDDAQGKTVRAADGGYLTIKNKRRKK